MVMRMPDFVWTPGTGMDTAALLRLQASFPQPIEPMGEAWFMGRERRLYRELLGPTRADDPVVKEALEELITGSTCFPPRPEWRDWYHHLLGRLLPHWSTRQGTGSLLEMLITGFIAQHIRGTPKDDAWMDDALHTLGRCVMERARWEQAQRDMAEFATWPEDDPHRWGKWEDMVADRTASLFLCLRYLPPPQVAAWFRSVLAIEEPEWRAFMVAWMVGAAQLLARRTEWPDPEASHRGLRLTWAWSFALSEPLPTEDTAVWTPPPPLVPPQAAQDVVAVIEAVFDPQTLDAWRSSVARLPGMRSLLNDTFVAFNDSFLSAQPAAAGAPPMRPRRMPD